MRRRRATPPETEKGRAIEETETGHPGSEEGAGSRLDFLGIFAEAKDHLVYAQVEFLTALKAMLEGFEKGVETRGEGTELKRLADSTAALRGLLDLAIHAVERFATPRGRDSKLRALDAIRDVLERERTEANRASPGPSRSAAVDGLSAIIRVLDREIEKIVPGKSAPEAKPDPARNAPEPGPHPTTKAERVRKVPIG